MPIYAVQDKSTVTPLFNGWEQSFFHAYLQGNMGTAYADSLDAPRCAQISLRDFILFASETNDELVTNRPANLRSDFAILAPQNDAWERAISSHFGECAQRHMRCGIKKSQTLLTQLN